MVRGLLTSDNITNKSIFLQINTSHSSPFRVNSNGTVVRSPSVGHEIINGEMEHGTVDDAGLDYALLQDILYEVVYFDKVI